MISKERLEELIKKGATIYTKYSEKYKLDENDFISIKCGKDFLKCFDNIEFIYDIDYLENLYETKEQAEWHLKYHATRIEELDLPMWEEFKNYNENISVSFVGEDWAVYELSNDIDIYHKPRILLTADGEYFEEWKSTEENYEKACDLCLKLFKGEE